MDKIFVGASFSFLHYICQRERWNSSGIVFQSNENISAIKRKKRQGFLKLQLQPVQVEILRLESVLQDNKKYFLSSPSKYSQLRNLPLDKRLAVRLIALFTWLSALVWSNVYWEMPGSLKVRGWKYKVTMRKKIKACLWQKHFKKKKSGSDYHIYGTRIYLYETYQNS